MKSSLNRTIDVISGLVQKHVIINNKIKQCTLSQQNYSELNNKLNNLQKLISSNISNSMKFYKCASVNIPQVSTDTQTNTETTTDTGKPTYIISNAGFGEEVNGTYTYLGEFTEFENNVNVLLWKNIKDNGYYIVDHPMFSFVLTLCVGVDESNSTLDMVVVPPLYAIIHYTDTDTFEVSRADGEADNITMTYASAEPETPSEPEVSKTWSGYELILNDGKYSVSEVLTEGLSYSAITPVVGNVYSQDASILAVPYMGWEAPYSGLVFYAPFSEASDTAETGQPFTFTGTPTFETKCGVPVIKFDSNTMLDTYIDANTTGSNILSDTVTMSFWAYVQPNVCFMTNCSRDINSLYYATRFYINSDYNLVVQNYPNTVTAEILPKESLAHFAYVFEGDYMKIYINGLYVTTQTTDNSSVNRLRSRMVIHCDTWYAPYDSILYMAALRVYKRALEPDEIAVLANEFTPTTEVVPDLPSDIVVGKPYGYKLAVYGLQGTEDDVTTFTQTDINATGWDRIWAADEYIDTYIRRLHEGVSPSSGWGLYTSQNEDIDNDFYNFQTEWTNADNPWEGSPFATTEVIE